MLVDDGAQLENQTILIDEAQLAAAGGRSGNVIIQVKKIRPRRFGGVLGFLKFSHLLLKGYFRLG